jgi:hypothetical protein
MSEAGVSTPLAQQLSHLPAGSALFAALLGYNPFAHLLSPDTLAAIGPAAARIVQPHFFAQLIAQPFIQSLRVAFYLSVGLCVIGAVASALRGRSGTVQPEPEPRAPLAGGARAPLGLGGEPSPYERPRSR